MCFGCVNQNSVFEPLYDVVVSIYCGLWELVRFIVKMFVRV